MSDYAHEKVLRYPVYVALEELDEETRQYFDYATPGKFQIAPTEVSYVDYVLESDYDCDCGEYGKTRALSESEKEAYRPIWQRVFPDIDMSCVRLVEFVWYNATEAPSYYDETKDSFYADLIDGSPVHESANPYQHVCEDIGLALEDIPKLIRLDEKGEFHKHKIVRDSCFHEMAECAICGCLVGGWYCPDSPDHLCDYEEKEGVPRYHCRYCGQPMVRNGLKR